MERVRVRFIRTAANMNEFESVYSKNIADIMSSKGLVKIIGQEKSAVLDLDNLVNYKKKELRSYASSKGIVAGLDISKDDLISAILTDAKPTTAQVKKIING